MLTFKQFIVETRWSKYLYHAEYDHPEFESERDKWGQFNPKNVKPGSHFGSLHAAMTRAIDLADARGNKDLKIHAFEYKSPNKTKTIKDTGVDDMHIHSQLSKRGVIMPHIPGFQNKEQHLQSQLKKRGIGRLSYTNTQEDPGSTSHIIYDTENLRHVHTFNAPKFAAGRYHVSQYRTSDNPKPPKYALKQAQQFHQKKMLAKMENL